MEKLNKVKILDKVYDIKKKYYHNSKILNTDDEKYLDYCEELQKYFTEELYMFDYKDFLEAFIPVMDEFCLNEKGFNSIVAMVLYSYRSELFINKELEQTIYKALNGKMDIEKIHKRLNNSVLILKYSSYHKGKSRFKSIIDDVEKGINDGNKSRINLFRHISYRDLIKTIIHESLHQAVHDNRDRSISDKKYLESQLGYEPPKGFGDLTTRGLRIVFSVEQKPSYENNYQRKKQFFDYYANINEAVTEFLTKLVMGDLYEEEADDYDVLVSILEELVEEDFLDVDTIIDAYISNSISIIKNKLDEKIQEKNLSGKLTSKELLDRFDNGYIPAKYKGKKL